MDSANRDPAVSRSQQKQTLNIVSVNMIDSELSKNDQRICKKKRTKYKKKTKKWERRQSARAHFMEQNYSNNQQQQQTINHGK